MVNLICRSHLMPVPGLAGGRRATLERVVVSFTRLGASNRLNLGVQKINGLPVHLRRWRARSSFHNCSLCRGYDNKCGHTGIHRVTRAIGTMLFMPKYY